MFRLVLSSPLVVIFITLVYVVLVVVVVYDYYISKRGKENKMLNQWGIELGNDSNVYEFLITVPGEDSSHFTGTFIEASNKSLEIAKNFGDDYGTLILFGFDVFIPVEVYSHENVYVGNMYGDIDEAVEALADGLR